jgi:23S rRNA (uridine2552-2'-O)-methyltransferase
MCVLDLGAAPGSWTQYAAPKVGARGKLVAVDLVALRVVKLPQVTTLEMDIFADLAPIVEHGPYDVVLSDMAPKTTGIAYGDAARSHELVERALDVCQAALKPGGQLVAKIFLGEGFEQVRDRMRRLFDTVRLIKPEASRKESVETFLYGIGFKAESPKP